MRTKYTAAATIRPSKPRGTHKLQGLLGVIQSMGVMGGGQSVKTQGDRAMQSFDRTQELGRKQTQPSHPRPRISRLYTTGRLTESASMASWRRRLRFRRRLGFRRVAGCAAR